MNDQEAFERSARHLLQQGERSLLESRATCAYRGQRGLTCAVGCLIPDDEYDTELEEKNAAAIVSQVPALHGVSVRLLGRLQSIHDYEVPSLWRLALEQLSKDFVLRMPEDAP
jgi:hypothetical protein